MACKFYSHGKNKLKKRPEKYPKAVEVALESKVNAGIIKNLPVISKNLAGRVIRAKKSHLFNLITGGGY